MATYKWSVPTGKQITGQTFLKDTDNNIADTIDDLVDFVNSEGNHTGQGLVYDLVDRLSNQTISGDKTFTGSLTGSLTGNISGNAAGTSSKLANPRTISLSGDVTGSVSFDGSTNVDMDTTVNIQPFISGMIMIWSGSSASIPSGWVLCDGTNSTPNLADRFLVGAGGSYSVGATGGSADAIIPAHSHTFSGETTLEGEHTHEYPSAGYDGTYGNSIDESSNAGGYISPLQSAGEHKHTFSGQTGTSGEDAVNKNLPPYYALCYIMKV